MVQVSSAFFLLQTPLNAVYIYGFRIYVLYKFIGTFTIFWCFLSIKSN
uniref:P5 n=1 Tax=Higrevirus waimanalo TaxID=3047949 RepID=A0AA51RFA8_9VIRU|nr:P5 [Higrevirus waimanalo]